LVQAFLKKWWVESDFKAPNLPLSLGEVYSIPNYVIKCVSDLREVGGFLRILRFPPPIKLTATI
jgi:hypothetical protein